MTAVQALPIPTPLTDERSIALITVLRDVLADLPIHTLRVIDSDQVSQAVLKHLIDEAGIRNWISSDMDEAAIRRLVASASEIHKHRGTLWAVRKALAAFGHEDVSILEGLDAEFYDGTIRYDRTHFYGQAATYWAQYRVFLRKTLTIEQASQIRKLLKQVAPTRCFLAGLHYREAQHLYNGEIFYDNTYTYGVA